MSTDDGRIQYAVTSPGFNDLSTALAHARNIGATVVDERERAQ